MGVSVAAIVQASWYFNYLFLDLILLCNLFELGNLTIFSNRILIRFTASSFKMDSITKKGFLAECSLVSSGIFLRTNKYRHVYDYSFYGLFKTGSIAYHTL